MRASRRKASVWRSGVRTRSFGVGLMLAARTSRKVWAMSDSAVVRDVFGRSGAELGSVGRASRMSESAEREICMIWSEPAPAELLMPVRREAVADGLYWGVWDVLS